MYRRARRSFFGSGGAAAKAACNRTINNVLDRDVGPGHVISLGTGEISYSHDISTTCPIALQIENKIQRTMEKEAR